MRCVELGIRETLGGLGRSSRVGFDERDLSLFTVLRIDRVEVGDLS